MCVGPQRAGTTFFEQIFRSYKKISMPEIKETNYWINNKVRKIIGEYSNYFNKKNGIWMEVDPKYIYYPEKIKQLKTSFKTVKIIIWLCNLFSVKLGNRVFI